MERRFLVIINGRKTTKVNINETLSYTSIVDMIHKTIDISQTLPHIIKYYDSDVEEFVDLNTSSVDEINVMKIVKIKIVYDCEDHFYGNTSNQHASDTQLNSNSIQFNSRNVQDCETQHNSNKTSTNHYAGDAQVRVLNNPQDGNTSWMQNNQNCGAESNNGRPVGSDLSGPQTNNSIRQKSYKPWARDYDVRQLTIPTTLRTKLDGQLELDITDRRHLLDAIYYDVTKFEGGLYPTPMMYNSIVDGLLKAYPHLLQKEMPIRNAREYWRDKLVFKFGNSRKRIDNKNPEVLSRKRKKHKESIPEPVNKKQLIFGLSYYLPENPISEDATSLDMHLGWLQREYRKKEPNINAVNSKMDLTFAARRKDVVSEKLSVKAVVDKYPWLQDRNQILKEYERLGPNTPVPNLEQCLDNGLKKYKKCLNDLTHGRKKPQWINELIGVRDACHILSERDYYDECLAMLMVPILFKEKPSAIFAKEGEDSLIELIVPESLFQMDDNCFSVKIEGTKVLSCDNFFQAIAGLIACIYTFDLLYPREWEKSLLFLQSIIIGLENTRGIDKRLVGVLHQVNTCLKK